MKEGENLKQELWELCRDKKDSANPRITNQQLAERLQLGLQRAQADGSLRQLFMQHHGQLLQQAQLSKRRLFLLSNPSLPPGTPKADTSWWLPATQKLTGQ